MLIMFNIWLLYVIIWLMMVNNRISHDRGEIKHGQDMTVGQFDDGKPQQHLTERQRNSDCGAAVLETASQGQSKTVLPGFDDFPPKSGKTYSWLVVLTILKNMKVSGKDYGKIKNV